MNRPPGTSRRSTGGLLFGGHKKGNPHDLRLPGKNGTVLSERKPASSSPFLCARIRSFHPGREAGHCSRSIPRAGEFYETQPASERRFEAHRKYIDVQLVLEGEERIDSSLGTGLKTLQEYNDVKDVMFLETPEDFATVVLKPGYFSVFFPHDVHRPNCSVRGARHVRKLVLKVSCGLGEGGIHVSKSGLFRGNHAVGSHPRDFKGFHRRAAST